MVPFVVVVLALVLALVLTIKPVSDSEEATEDNGR